MIRKSVQRFSVRSCANKSLSKQKPPDRSEGFSLGEEQKAYAASASVWLAAGRGRRGSGKASLS